jgi:putative transposase
MIAGGNWWRAKEIVIRHLTRRTETRYRSRVKTAGAADRHEVGRRLNNRAENSHQPFRRRERAMQRFRSLKTLQKFSSVHAQVHNQFNQERHLITRQVYKQRRSAALAEWRALAA